jgi:hypothetical protein
MAVCRGSCLFSIHVVSGLGPLLTRPLKIKAAQTFSEWLLKLVAIEGKLANSLINDLTTFSNF